MLAEREDGGFGAVRGADFREERIDELLTHKYLAIPIFFCIMLLVGPLLDTCSVFTMLTRLTPAAVLSVYGAGVPVNLIHAACAALTMLLVSKPLLSKLHRVKEKYGMLEERL